MTFETRRLPTPEPGRWAAEQFVTEQLSGLFCEPEVISSPRFRGGQTAAEKALRRFDVAGYAKRRNEAFPETRRVGSRLSPYIRHGLLPLARVWEHVSDGPADDVKRFRDELLWQEYARHWYARLGRRTNEALRQEYRTTVDTEPWDLRMACLELTIDELEEDGWLVNQTRLWLASHWSVRNGYDWSEGEDYFFRHLLDGSRAANRLGWQWTTGVGATKAYGFSRWQVEKRAPGLCSTCDLGAACPIDLWPPDPDLDRIIPPSGVRHDPDLAATRGPAAVQLTGTPEAVWLTAESLGFEDQALTAHPELPVVFVFDQPLLRRLQLSSKRLVFLTEALAEIAANRSIELLLGDPIAALADRPLATTFAPVPGWRKRSTEVDLAALYPWPWLREPIAGSIRTFTTWADAVRANEESRKDVSTGTE